MSVLRSMTVEHDAVAIAYDHWLDDEIDDDELAQVLQDTVEIHIGDEERLLLPALNGSASPEILDEARSQHKELRQQLETLVELDGERRRLALVVLAKAMLKHMAWEEDAVYLTAQQSLSIDELKELQSARKACSCNGFYA